MRQGALGTGAVLLAAGASALFTGTPLASTRAAFRQYHGSSSSSRRCTRSRGGGTTRRITPTARDFPKPNVEDTDPYREANALSKRFMGGDLKLKAGEAGKKVAIVGGGLSGLACAKYLADAGHTPMVYEARPELGEAWERLAARADRLLLVTRHGDPERANRATASRLFE